MKTASLKAAVFIAAAACTGALAAADGAREAFLKRQAIAEVQRITGQIDVLQSNYDELSDRIKKIDGGKEEIAALKKEIDAVKADLADLRREISAMKSDIVREISAKIAEVQKAEARSARASAASSGRTPPAGKYREYVVVKGDSLYLIAQAFNTTIAKITELNGLKSNKLSIGQKLLIP